MLILATRWIETIVLRMDKPAETDSRMLLRGTAGVPRLVSHAVVLALACLTSLAGCASISRTTSGRALVHTANDVPIECSSKLKRTPPASSLGFLRQSSREHGFPAATFHFGRAGVDAPASQSLFQGMAAWRSICSDWVFKTPTDNTRPIDLQAGCERGRRQSEDTLLAPRETIQLVSHCLPTPPQHIAQFRFSDDLRRFGPTVWEDAKGLANPENALILGFSLAAAIGIRQDLDDQVRESTEANPLRWGEASRALGALGEAQYQVPILFAVWGHSVHTHDPYAHSFSEALISAYTISGLSTLAIKGVTNTDRPDSDWNNGQWGFPSFHAASTFTMAAVLEEYYGWELGIPAYTLAGLISWSRIDERDHDLSDVVFGAAMGWLIGKSVAGQHLRDDGRVRLMPWVHPFDGAAGVRVDASF